MVCGVDNYTWIDPDGIALPLPVVRGGTGRWSPPVNLQELVSPFQPGATTVALAHQPRPVVLPIAFSDDDPAVVRLTFRQLAHAFNPLRGHGLLQCDADDGISRVLACHMVAGLDTAVENSVNFQTVALTFRAADDPYWRDLVPTSLSWQVASSTPTARWFPIFPLVLGSSEVFGSQGVVNLGDVNAWPVITITGPGSDLVVTHNETGKRIAFDGAGFSLDAHQSIVVDTWHATATRSDGTPMLPELSFDSELWPLPPGESSITVDMAGADQNSSVAFTFTPGWLNP